MKQQDVLAPTSRNKDIPSTDVTRLEQAAYYLLTLAALGVGIVSLRYALPSVPFPGVPGNWADRRSLVVVHAITSSVAILVGPWQFLKLKGGSRRAWHRWMGRTYLVAVLFGWLSSIPIAVHAQTGRVAQAGFVALGIAWIVASSLAYVTILQRQVHAHRRWMVRSYALTCAAITLRIMIPVAALAGFDFERAYGPIAWACWIVNLVLAEAWLARTSVSTRKLRASPAVSGPTEL